MIRLLAQNLDPEATAWWSAAMTDGPAVTYALILGAGCLVLAPLLRAMWRLPTPPSPPSAASPPSPPAASALRGPRRSGGAGGCDERVGREELERGRSWPRRVWSALHAEGGTATVEFVLVFGPALLICLLLLQTVLLFSANCFVNYAAYAAVRSAIVNVPSGELGGGGRLAIGDAAFESAQRAAAHALTPVSGAGSTATGTRSGLVDGLHRLYDHYDATAPNWVDRLAAARQSYALQHTQLVLMQAGGGANRAAGLSRVTEDEVVYGPKDPVSLGVRHRLHLSVPFASRVFADGRHETAAGSTAYADVFAVCTMPLEGYDRNLPPPPVDEQGRVLERQP